MLGDASMAAVRVLVISVLTTKQKDKLKHFKKTMNVLKELCYQGNFY